MTTFEASHPESVRLRGQKWGDRWWLQPVGPLHKRRHHSLCFGHIWLPGKDYAPSRSRFRGERPTDGSGANFKKGRRADPGALGERESLACQIGPKFKLCTRTINSWGERYSLRRYIHVGS